MQYSPPSSGFGLIDVVTLAMVGTAVTAFGIHGQNKQ